MGYHLNKFSYESGCPIDVEIRNSLTKIRKMWNEALLWDFIKNSERVKITLLFGYLSTCPQMFVRNFFFSSD